METLILGMILGAALTDGEVATRAPSPPTVYAKYYGAPEVVLDDGSLMVLERCQPGTTFSWRRGAALRMTIIREGTDCSAIVRDSVWKRSEG